jgi:hypothetical protein
MNESLHSIAGMALAKASHALCQSLSMALAKTQAHAQVRIAIMGIRH